MASIPSGSGFPLPVETLNGVVAYCEAHGASDPGGEGAGSPGNLDKELGEIVKNRSAVVVQSSRVGEGRIVRDNNWYEPDMVVADNLSPQKAAILLSLALTKTSSPQDIQRFFYEY